MSFFRQTIRTAPILCASMTLLASMVLSSGGQDIPADALVEESTGPRELFALRGIDASHFGRLVDGRPWQAEDDEFLLTVIYQIRRDFRLVDVRRWSREAPAMAELARDPDAARGEIFRLTGRVVDIDVCRPAPDMAARFELSQYYRCEILLDEEKLRAVVFTRTIPEAFESMEPIDERAGAMGFFLKFGSDAPNRPVPIFVAPRVAWYPETVLGELGMDVGLLDDLRPAETATDPEDKLTSPAGRPLKDLRLTARNRECFYQMLAAAGRAKPGQLSTEANRELARSGQQRFSVVPLFMEPLGQLGRLVELSGTTRQVIRIRVEEEDVQERFGIDHYYQVFLFTDDCQGQPLVFCVRELPEGMPTGEGGQFAESITVAGFFFNTWAYRSREVVDPSSGPTPWQMAPLLIGRRPVWHPQRPPARNPLFGAIAGGLFLLALAGIWLAVWRTGRRDKQFRDRTRARPDQPIRLP